MFLGTTTAPVRDYMAQEIRAAKPKKLFEPFAGIFMVSQIVGMIDKNVEVHSSDVSMYSVEVGCGLAAIASPVTPKPLLFAEFPGFADMQQPIQRAAIMVFMAEAAVAYRKRHLNFYGRLYEDMRRRHVDYVKKLVAKAEQAKQNLPLNFTFHASDGVALMAQAQAGDVVFYDPPFWSGGYEKMFEALPDWYDMAPIPFTEVTSDLRDIHLQQLRERGCTVYYRCEKPLDPVPAGYELVFQAEYKHNGWFLVYSNNAATKAIRRNDRMRETPKGYNVVGPKTVFTAKSKIDIVPVGANVANHFRLLWTKKADMVSMGTAFLATVNGAVFGVMVMDSGQAFSSTYARIISDVGSTHTVYGKLSKLILGLILSNEFLKTVNDKFMCDHDGYTTVAYSDAPVSMKYRGLFDLAERKAGTAKKYELIYRTKKLRHPTLKAAFKHWLSKYADDRTTDE